MPPAIACWDTARTLAIVTGRPSVQTHRRLAAQLRQQLHAAKLLFFGMPTPTGHTRLGETELSGELVRFAKVDMAAFSIGSVLPASAFLAGVKFSNRLFAGGQYLRGILLFLDQRHMNLQGFIAGYGRGAAADVPMLGAVGIGSNRFSAVSMMLCGQLQGCAVCGIAFYGKNLRFSIGVESGFSSYDAGWIVTRARGNTILEMDDKPALLRVSQAIGPLIDSQACKRGVFALGITTHAGLRKPVLRSILKLEERNKSILLDHRVEEGERVTLMHATQAQVSGAIRSLADTAALRHGNGPSAFALSIAGGFRPPNAHARFDVERQLFAKSLSPQIAHSSVCAAGILFADARSSPMFHSQTSAFALIEEIDSPCVPAANQILRRPPSGNKRQVAAAKTSRGVEVDAN